MSLRAGTILLLLTLLVGCTPVAEDAQQRAFLGANGRYENGDYQGALDGYLQLERDGVHRASLDYNIGNCYFKLGQLAGAILYYERCLALSPRDEDAKHNLAYARSRTIDETNPPAGLQALEEALGGGALFARREVWVLTVVCYVLFIALLALGQRWPSYRPFVYLRLCLLVGLTVSLALYAYLGWHGEARRRGVVMISESNVLNEPREDGTLKFKLHQGITVRLLRRHEDWLAISVGGELKGWVPFGDVEEI
jgi:tetratricopeptide (TPR) repeat protein